MKKKLLALMMVFVMLLSASPMAFAAQTADQLLDEAKTELMSSKVKDVLQTAVKFIDDNKADIYKVAYDAADNEGYIEDVKNALDAAADALDDLAVAALDVDDELKAAIDAAIVALKEDIGAVKLFLGDAASLEGFVENVWGLLDEFKDDADELESLLAQAGEDGWEILVETYEVVAPKVEKICGEIYAAAAEKLGELYGDVVEAVLALAKEAEEYNILAEQFVREWLYENPKAVMEAVMAYGQDVDAVINHIAADVELILGPAWEAYGDELQAAIAEILAVLKDEATPLAEKAAAELITYVDALELDTQIETIVAALQEGSVAIGAETVAELEATVAELEVELAAKVDAIVAALEALKADCDEAAADAEPIIDAAIADVRAMEDEFFTEMDKIKGHLEELKPVVEQAAKDAEAWLEANSGEIEDFVNNVTVEQLAGYVGVAAEYAQKFLDGEYDGEIEDFMESEEMQDALAHANTLLDMAWDVAVIAGDAAKEISELTIDINAAAEAIDGAIVGMNADLLAALGEVEGTLTNAGADAAELLGEAYAAAEALVVKTADKVITDATALMAECELKLTAAVEALMAEVETVLYKATHGAVKGDCTSVYTAIGDEVEGLAEALGLTAGELSEKTALVTVNFEGEELSAFVNAQIAGMIANTVAANEDLVNLINGGYGETVIAELEKLGIDLNATLVYRAWENYLDATAISVKDETLANIAEVLVHHDVLMDVYTLDVGAMISPMISAELGIEVTVNCIVEIPVAELVVTAVDSLLYAYVDAAASFAAELEAVRAVAPEAEIVVLGLTDAAEELQVKIGNMAIDLAEYEEVMNAFVSAHYFAYALVNGENTTFVADAEAIEAALTVDVAGHVWNAYAQKDDEVHYLVCSVCGVKGETEAHTLVDNKCVCGYEKEETTGGGGGGGGSRKWHCPWCKSNTCHSAAFTDLDLDAWYHEYTDYVLCKGMMNGMGGNLFAPNGETSRAMLTTILYRMAGSPAVTGEMPFADVAAGQWYSDAILWAAQNDVVLGYVDGNFGPMDTITREQIAAMFFRFAELKKMDTSKAADLSAYKDAASVGAWATDYMEWAVSVGLMKGRAADTLAPAAGTTRAETAALLERWCEEIAD